MKRKVLLMNTVGVGLFFFLAFQLVWVKGGVLTTHPLPSITSFTPSSGLPGEIIKVIGTNFQVVTSSTTYRVKVNGVKAEVIGDTAKNQIHIRVPQGASSGRISIEEASGVTIASSKGSFEVVPGPLHDRHTRENNGE